MQRNEIPFQIRFWPPLPDQRPKTLHSVNPVRHAVRMNSKILHLRFVGADGRLSGVMEHADKNQSQRKTLKEKDIVCLGHLKRAFGLLDRLHEVGTERDKAGNRQLHFDEYCKLVLLYIWNPLIGSVHDLQQAVGLPNVAKTLNVKRFSAGSFSESVRVFDPEQLKPILAELAGDLEPYAKDPRLGELKTILTLDFGELSRAVDGTVLTALARLAKAAVGLDSRYNTSRDGKGSVRLEAAHPV